MGVDGTTKVSAKFDEIEVERIEPYFIPYFQVQTLTASTRKYKKVCKMPWQGL